MHNTLQHQVHQHRNVVQSSAYVLSLVCRLSRCGITFATTSNFTSSLSIAEAILLMKKRALLKRHQVHLFTIYVAIH